MNIPNHENFYITGGTIPPDSPCYVPRIADRELLTALKRGELCYVLNARQMGKSSLSVRTRQALEASGVRTAFLDLQKFGSSGTREQWYRGLLDRIGSDLKLRAEFSAYWRENADVPALTRLFNALREVALEHIPGNLVVFLDEIDVVRDQSFKTDEFFGAIRQAYNERVNDDAFTRLTFCIIGTVAPTDLIRDARLSPFNIGTRVKLSDLTREEALPLAGPLPGGDKTLIRIFRWTNGHPYLTQRLCAELTRKGSTDVDAMVAQLFFAKSDAEIDENIKNVRNGLLRMGMDDSAGFDRTDLLTRYGAIAAGKRVPDDDRDGVCAALRLSGLVTATQGLLRVRNRVYAHIFDTAWVRSKLPDAEVRRQRAAVAKARCQIGSIAAAVLLVMTALLWQTRKAEQNATAAKNEAVDARRIAEEKGVLAQQQKNQADAAKDRAVTALNQAESDRLMAQHQSKRADMAKYEAQASAKKARAATTQAQTAAVQARDAQKGEKAAKSKAEANADRALLQATRADREAKVALHTAYISAIELTDQNLDNGNYDVARQFFDDVAKVPPGEHGFEWDYLKEHFHQALFTLRGHKDIVESVTFSSDGRYIATGGPGSVRVWDAASGKALSSTPVSEKGVYRVSFSPDGKRFIIFGDSSSPQVWDTTTGKALFSLKGHQAAVSASTFSPDGKYLATASSDKTVRVWDAASGKQVAGFKGNPAGVYGYPGGFSSVAVSSDNTRFAAGHDDGTVQVWDVAHKKTFFLKGHTGYVVSAKFSPDGKRLVTGCYDTKAKIWDLETEKEIITLQGHTLYVLSVAFSPDGKRIATASADSTARVWDAATGKTLFNTGIVMASINSVSFSPDGKRLATASGDVGKKGETRVWDVENTDDTVVLRGHTGDVFPAAYSPDGKRMVTAGKDKIIRLWDTATGKTVLTIKSEGWLSCVTLSPDGKRIASVQDKQIDKPISSIDGFDSKVQILNAVTGAKLLAIKGEPSKGHIMAFSSVAFSPDGKRLATGSVDGTAYVRDAMSGKVLLTLKGDTTKGMYGRLDSIAFSSDGKRIVATTSGQMAHVWDAATGKVLLVLKGAALGFFPDSKRLAVSDEYGTVHVLNAATGKVSFSLKGHTMLASSIAFSPDGKRIATGSYDATARVWDAATGRVLLIRKAHSGYATGVTFSPDGKQLVTTGGGTVKIWRKPTLRQREAMQSQADHETHSE